MARPALRVLAGTVDQVLSSVSNALIVFAVARASSAADFGNAVLLYSIIAAAIGLGRGAFGTPLLLMGGRPLREIVTEARSATTAAIAFGGVVAIVVAGVSVGMGDPGIGIEFAAACPIVLAQDALRYAALALGAATAALWSDLVWTAGSLALLAITWFKPGSLPATAIVWGWACAAMLAGGVLIGLLRLSPTSRNLARWWRARAGFRLRFAADSGVEQLTVIVVVAVSSALAGPTAAAALRGAVTILGPFAIALNALTLVTLPEARRSRYSPARLRRMLRLLALPASLAAVAIGACAPLVPARLGALLLGASWHSAASVLPILGLEYGALCWVSAAYNLFRFREAANTLATARIAQSVLTVESCVIFAVLVPTPTGIATALAFTACFSAAALTVMTSGNPTTPRTIPAPLTRRPRVHTEAETKPLPRL